MYKRKNRPAHESKWIPGVLSRKSSVIVGGCRLAGGGGGRGWSLAIGDGWWVGVGGLWLTRSGSSHSLKCS